MKKTSRKYQAILGSAKELFWKHGLKRVSVEEICHKALVSKMTFYRYFDNKTELAKAVYDQVVDEGIAQFKQIMSDKETTPEEKMQKILQMKMEGTNDISSEFLQDFYNRPEKGLPAYVEEKTRLVWKEIIKDFKIGQRKGWFRKDFKPEAFFIVSTKISELLSDPAMLHMYATPQELVMELAKLFTFGIIPREEGAMSSKG
ncbi:MAG: TetR/AcrR family transcriptional regulator [Bacteroidales bacterium]|jgi:AcrR family transcriptional regulator|nr:TetR/AcrR family transcriptional regulator [Bacteroidales bacterium]NLM93501.1 TetR/AcrR family transcriptional regulator [Bacteroidales bacterium]